MKKLLIVILWVTMLSSVAWADVALSPVLSRTGSVTLAAGENYTVQAALYGSHVLMGVYKSATTGGIAVVDVSDPTTPTEKVYKELGYPVAYITIDGNYAYVSEANTGGKLHKLDISDISDIQDIASLSNGGGGVTITDENYIYSMAGSKASPIFKIIDKNTMVSVGSLSLATNEYTLQLFKQDNYVYMATRHTQAALVTIDVSDPASPVKVGDSFLFDADENIGHVGVRGRYAFVGIEQNVTSGVAEIVSLDLYDPEHPARISTLNLTADDIGLLCSLVGRYFYCSSDQTPSYVKIIDTDDPANMSVVSSLTLIGENHAGYLSQIVGDKMYIPLSNIPGGLVIVGIGAVQAACDENYVPAPTSCGIGACASTGQLICQGGSIIDTCTPVAPQTEGPAGSPNCSDGLDNDCDGLIDTADPDCQYPDLVISLLSAPVIATPEKPIIVSDTTSNNGAGTASASTTKFYLSKNIKLASKDIYLGGRAIPALKAKSSDSGSISVTVPKSTRRGTYYILAVPDGDKVAPQANETNNIMSSQITVAP